MPRFRAPKGVYFAGGMDVERNLQITSENATGDASYRKCVAPLAGILECQMQFKSGHFLFEVIKDFGDDVSVCRAFLPDMLCGRLPLIVLFFCQLFLVRRLPYVWPCSAEAFEFADPLTLPWHLMLDQRCNLC